MTAEPVTGTRPDRLRRTAIGGPTRRARLTELLRGPGCLLTWLLAFTPLWWVMGLGALIFPILAVPMAVSLVRRRRIELPPGFGLWLAFCLAVVISLLALGTDPPGTMAGGWWERVPGALYRLSGYVTVTVVALYAVNLSERRFPRRRLINLLAWLAVVTVAGGLLGTYAGHLEFVSPVEALLPSRVAKDGFVQSLVHPQAAQVMDFLGYETPRPAAPWGYTNSWGNMMAICVPWLAVAAMSFPVRLRWRVAAVATAAIALIPVVESMNRGLWLNLGAAGVFVTARLLVAGKLWPMAIVTLAAVAATVVVATTPLGGVVATRIANGHSDEGRAYATAQALAALPHSPVLGFGSTRKTEGSSESIAIGPTEDCPRCGGRTVGGNGQLWQNLFAHGLTGAIAYIGFFCLILWRFRRDHSATGIVGSVVMVMSLTSMFYYNALLPPLVATMLCYALLWRNERDQAIEASQR